MRGYPELTIPDTVWGSPEYKYNQYLVKHREKQNKGGNTLRDSERQKTYNAENQFMSQLRTEGIKTGFKDLKEAQRFSKKVYKTKKWGKLWKDSLDNDMSRIFNATPEIVAMKRHSKTMSGYTNGKTVTLCPISGMNKYILLHELAHCLGHMHHGRSFRQCVLELTGTFLGAKAKKLLKAQFKKYKLACGDAKKPMTFEKWNASRVRMQEMRKEKNG